MKRGLFALGLAALVLAACENREAKQQEFPVVEAPNYDANIGPNGAAGITQALPMTLDAVRAAAPNYVVAQVQQQVEGEPFTAITLSAGDEVVFQINPTADGAHIHSITTDSTQARGPLGEIVGRSVFDAPEEETEFCASEQVQGAAGFACSTAADGRFWRVYRLPADYDGPSDPFDAIDPDVLHAATLAEMRWVAPRV
ncbi:MAG: hypothetical protein JNK94_07355 [Hyphomonadaceae bacterium]|nr:hypothetical protein [Hyphomonadaceae bacterium]